MFELSPPISRYLVWVLAVMVTLLPVAPALNSQLAVDAACYGIEHKLPLADSIIYATAQKYEATLWTQDADFKGLEGVKFYSKHKIT